MKKKNEGFTLVELVIAVVILAIAISPLVSNFIQSSKMNLKAKKQLNAMNLAQDIMEGMTQHTVSNNHLYFENSVSDNTILVTKNILPNNTTITRVAADAGNTEYGLCKYKLEGVRTAAGGYNEYDVYLQFDPTKVNGSDTAAADVNNQDFANITPVDQYYDAVETITSENEKQAWIELQKKAKHSNDTTAYKGLVKREITIEIKNEMVADVNNYSATIRSVYSLCREPEHTSAIAALGFDDSNIDSVYVEDEKVISKCESDTCPRSVYLYYEPMSGSTYVDSMDTFKVKNTSGKEVTVYLIRTINKSKIADPEMDNRELFYGSEVFVNSSNPKLDDDGKVELDADGKIVLEESENTDIVYNLRYRLTKDNNEKIYKEGTTTYLPGKDSDDLANSFYKEYRAKLHYNNDTDVVDAATYEKHFFDGYRKTKKNVLYDVTILIKEAGKTETIATYTGGLSN